MNGPEKSTEEIITSSIPCVDGMPTIAVHVLYQWTSFIIYFVNRMLVVRCMAHT